MNPSRLIKILLVITGLLAFAILAFFLLHRPKHPQTPFISAVDTAEKITLQTGPARIELDRDGTSWTVSTSSGVERYNADPDKIKTLETGLRNINVEDVISDRPDRAAEFEVNPESATHITVYGKNATLLAEGIFGKQVPDFIHLYFKFPGQPDIYLARGAIRGELGEPVLKGWRDHSLLNVAEDQILNLSIQGPGFKTVLVRSSDTWSCNGKNVNPTLAWGMLGVLAHLKADDFADLSQHPELAAGKLKYAEVSVKLRDGSSHSVHIGLLDKKTQRYPVAVDNDPSVAWVVEGTVKSFLKKPADFNPK